VKVLPCRSILTTLIAPPCRATITSTAVRPMPTPLIRTPILPRRATWQSYRPDRKTAEVSEVPTRVRASENSINLAWRQHHSDHRLLPRRVSRLLAGCSCRIHQEPARTSAPGSHAARRACIAQIMKRRDLLRGQLAALYPGRPTPIGGWWPLPIRPIRRDAWMITRRAPCGETLTTAGIRLTRSRDSGSFRSRYTHSRQAGTAGGHCRRDLVRRHSSWRMPRRERRSSRPRPGSRLARYDSTGTKYKVNRASAVPGLLATAKHFSPASDADGPGEVDVQSFINEHSMFPWGDAR